MAFPVSASSSLGILSAIRRNQLNLTNSLERLSTGRRINRASDDPSGLVIAEQLRAQLGGISAATRNTERAQNILRTAEGGLSQVSDQLIILRSLAVQAAGANSNEERQAIQAAADATVSSISRIAGTTRFGTTSLLSGASSITTSSQSTGIDRIDINSANLRNGSVQVDINVTSLASQAETTETFDDQAAASSIRVTGATGSQVLDISAGATSEEITAQVNAFSDETGVEANFNSGTGEFTLRSTDVGSSETVTVNILSGTFADTAASGASDFSATGTDIDATANGATVAAEGNTVTVRSGNIDAEVDIDANAAPGTFSFTASGGGLPTQFGTGASDNTTLGIAASDATSLGLSGLDFENDAAGALAAIDEAITRVTSERAEIGAFSSQTLSPLQQNLETQFINLSATESAIRDTDFAASIIEQQRTSLLLNAAISVLGQQNSIQSSGLLRLLGGL